MRLVARQLPQLLSEKHLFKAEAAFTQLITIIQI